MAANKIMVQYDVFMICSGGARVHAIYYEFKPCSDSATDFLHFRSVRDSIVARFPFEFGR